MSWNLNVAVAQADHDNEIRPMVLPRVHRGITSTARIRVGDLLDFDGIRIVVHSIMHHHQAAASSIAPLTVAYASTEQPVFDREIDGILREHGFRDLGA